MNHRQVTLLALKQLPRELSGFEIEAFFTFTASERALIEARRGPSLKLGLALQIGFLRMSGRVLDTHGYTDFGMALSHGEGFDLCPRLRALKDRHLFLPRGCSVHEILKPRG
jgi:hypothetical protein